MIKCSAGELPSCEMQLFGNCYAIKVLPGHSRSWGKRATSCACDIQSEPCVHSPDQLTELPGPGSVHLMGENSLIKKGLRGAELWECSTGWYVAHLPNCSCPSMEKILLTPDILLNQRQILLWDTSLFLQKISFHPKCNAGGGKTPPAPSPASPTIPGSTENTAIFTPHFHNSSEWCCTDRGSSLECKCGQRKVWKGKKKKKASPAINTVADRRGKQEEGCQLFW